MRDYIIGLLILCYCGFWLFLATLNDYHTCAAPIQIFFFGAPAANIFMAICAFLLQPSCLSKSMKIYLDTFYYFVFTLVTLFIVIFGVSCQIINQSQSPKCVDGKSTFMPFALYLGQFSLPQLLITIDAIQRAKILWRIYQFRRASNFAAAQREYQRLADQILEVRVIQGHEIGLELSQIEKLERRSYQPSLISNPSAEDQLESCSICYIDYISGDPVIVLPKCRHVFHDECASDWLKKSLLCPLCRENVQNAIEQDEIIEV